MAQASKKTLKALTVHQLALLTGHELKRGRPSFEFKDQLVDEAYEQGVTARDIESV
jgi:hypothetical protein